MFNKQENEKKMLDVMVYIEFGVTINNFSNWKNNSKTIIKIMKRDYARRLFNFPLKLKHHCVISLVYFLSLFDMKIL